jgi:hypothetical protein
MIEYKVITIAIKLELSTIANAITLCNKLDLFNKNWSCITMDYLTLCHSFISNNLTIMHGDLGCNFKN